MFRNIYSEKSKADDIQFILDLIAKIGAEIPEADMNNVNVAGVLHLIFTFSFIVIIAFIKF